MDRNIQEILFELYEIDPRLKEKESELIPMLNEILVSRPNTKIDKHFESDLRQRLLEKISATSTSKDLEAKELNNNFNFMKRLYYAFGGAIIASILIVPMMYMSKNKPNNLVIKDNDAILQEAKIARLGEKAFGNLQSQSNGNSSESASSYMKGLGGGGGLTSPTAERGMADSAVGSTNSSAGSMIAPDEWQVTNYKYVYKGDPITIDQDKMDVLKRIKGLGAGVDLSQIISGSAPGIDLSTFSNTKIQSLSILEDKDYGYSIYFDFNEGMVSISENWMKWSMQDCFGDSCPEYQPIKPSDIPADAKLISMANDFIKKHGINTEDYGEPEVADTWRGAYETLSSATERSAFYIPEIASVVYPLKVDGKLVYDDGGNKNGLTVNINLRKMKVGGAWNMVTQKYQGSLYETEKNTDTILKIAEKGGIYGYIYEDAKKTVEIEIGTPQMVYMRMYNYKNNQNDELLVPALMFPITKNLPSEMQWRRSVIVPLAKELLENNQGGGPIRILEKPMSLPAIEN